MADPTQSGRRVLMVALDSMEITLLERFFEQGELPNLAAFARASSRASVRSDGDLLHGSVWPTFASSTGPGSHGIYFWTQWKAEDMSYVRNSDPVFDFEPFWMQLAAANLRATAIDVPYIRPTTVPGFRVAAGWGMHDEMAPVSSPAGFMPWIASNYGKHPLQFDVVEPLDGRGKLKMARDLRRGVHQRAKLLRDLVAARESEFTVVVFSELHKAMHYLAAPEELRPGITNERAIGAILDPLDRAWPAIIEAAGDECDVFLFALHGIHEQRPYDGFGAQIVDLLAGRRPADAAAQQDLIRRIRNLLPRAVHEAIWRRLPASLRASRHGTLQTGNAELAKERLFRVAYDGHPAFRANLRGRERDGSVAPGADEELFRRLEALGTSLATTDGTAAFQRLWRSSETPGPRSHRLPDAILVANHAVARAGELLGPDGVRLTTVARERRNGAHTGKGFVFARLATAALTRTEVDPRDFGPSALTLLGVQGEGLEGEPFVAA